MFNYTCTDMSSPTPTSVEEGKEKRIPTLLKYPTTDHPRRKKRERSDPGVEPRSTPKPRVRSTASLTLSSRQTKGLLRRHHCHRKKPHHLLSEWPSEFVKRIRWHPSNLTLRRRRMVVTLSVSTRTTQTSKVSTSMSIQTTISSPWGTVDRSDRGHHRHSTLV